MNPKEPELDFSYLINSPPYCIHHAHLIRIFFYVFAGGIFVVFPLIVLIGEPSVWTFFGFLFFLIPFLGMRADIVRHLNDKKRWKSLTNEERVRRIHCPGN